jgi:hypothetical protein
MHTTNLLQASFALIRSFYILALLALRNNSLLSLCATEALIRLVICLMDWIIDCDL